MLEKLRLWSQINELEIKTTIFKPVIFRAISKPFIRHDVLQRVSAEINIVGGHKTLGVVLSVYIQWSNHIHYLCKASSKVAGTLAGCRSILPVNIKLGIYHSLFNSNTNYLGTTTKTDTKHLYMLYKQILRFIANVDYSYHTKTPFKKY